MATHTRRYGGNPAAVAIAVIADIAAIVIGLWILMYVLDANRTNSLVDFIQDSAAWLAGWSRDMFQVNPDWWRVLLNYGIAAVVYLAIGHALARTVRRF
ncbi:hypothetical protein G5C51_24835 [Streptomyces sp. A7024]|uniref:Uncharacterized protein n=1 Tax=Streptomyces coryli TaxID=1128680 RepID=A0A6G4U538_9ACTN|nr:hypothetical protein [Streptomyces coryli]NGN67122.1 hypothetical protein [Streptomyces coryli]